MTTMTQKLAMKASKHGRTRAERLTVLGEISDDKGGGFMRRRINNPRARWENCFRGAHHLTSITSSAFKSSVLEWMSVPFAERTAIR